MGPPARIWCLIVGATLVTLRHWAVMMRGPPDSGPFSLILRSRDPLAFAPAALKHYAGCAHLGAVRVVKDTSGSWNLTSAHLALSARDRQSRAGHGGYQVEALAQMIEAASMHSRVADLLEARPRGNAVLLASDDVWIDCVDVQLAFESWRGQTTAIVGTLALSHVLRPESGQHAWLDYKVSRGVDKHGSYSMVSLNGAFVHRRYLQQAAERQRKQPGCDEVWLNHQVALDTQEPPIYARATFKAGPHSEFSSTRSSLYYDVMSKCLSRLASENAGRLDLMWKQRVTGGSSRKNELPQYSNASHDQFPMVDDLGSNHGRNFLMDGDRMAGVSVVLVMETKPSEVASAVRHLHARHAFIREAVIWNNRNETMNHHMFPYDISVRYVMAPKNYSVYSRYLGCMLARYEICFFQHERMRPVFVAGLYAAFLARPDVIVAASDPKSALIVRHNMTYFDESIGRLTGYADMDEGAMVHKDLVRQFVERMSLDDAHSFHERAADADLYFTFSQPTLPMVLTHTTWTNNKPRVFPQIARIGKALAFSFWFAPSKEPVQGFRDPRSGRHKYFKAPCGKSRECAFATSLDAWPKPAIVNLGHNTTALKPARFYADSLAYHLNGRKDSNSSNYLLPAVDAALHYYWAVDGELSTVWRAELPPKPSFVGLELLAPTTIVGVNLWCKKEFAPVPTLQLGFHGHADYQTALCGANWTSDGALRLLRYECPPVRVNRVRLILQAVPVYQRLEIAEFAVEKLNSTNVQAAEDFASGVPALAPPPGGTNAGPPPRAPAPPDIGDIIYILQDHPDDYCKGEKLALLEEACELGALYPGKVKAVYMGDAPNVSLDMFASAFGVLGSECDVDKTITFEAVPVASVHQQAAEDGGVAGLDLHDYHPFAHASVSTRRREVYDWWVRRNFNASVVLFDPHESPLLYVLRIKQEAFANAVFLARSARLDDDGTEESLALADATTVSSKKDYVKQAQGPAKWEQQRRILYPLRTLRERPSFLETPTNPAIEEVIALVTPATTPDDMDLFNTYALPILQQRADVRLANVTAMQHGLAKQRTDDQSTSSRVKRPKWYTLHDVVYYVSIYPARTLWILDTSLGSAFYASLASVVAARFIAAPAAIPHWESRILAWNASCDWTAEGFAGKARELVRGQFDLSSRIADRDALQHDAPNVIVEEWPIKRLMAPFANTVADIAKLLAELVASRRAQRVASGQGQA